MRKPKVVAEAKESGGCIGSLVQKYGFYEILLSLSHTCSILVGLLSHSAACAPYAIYASKGPRPPIERLTVPIEGACTLNSS